MIESSKILFEPRVYLVGSQVVENDGLQQFLDDNGASGWTTNTDIPAQVLPEVAGRLCYESYNKPRPGGNKAYLDHIIAVGHESVLEHSVWSVVITGISRSLSHELVRHRVGISPSQLSMRYVDESKCRFVVPPFLKEEVRAALAYQALHQGERDPEPLEKIGAEWLASVNMAQHHYVHLVEHLLAKSTKLYPLLTKTEARKKARQSARSVLPHATETKIFLTGNARAWRHFFGLRANRHADDEIRILAGRILELLKSKAPNLFSDFTSEQLPDGTTEYTVGGPGA